MIILSFLLFMTGCHAMAPVRSAKNTDDVSLTSLVKATANKIEVLATLRNDGEVPIWINGRMAFAEETCKESGREISLRLLDENHRTLSDECTASIAPISASAYRVLKHGHAFSNEIDLSACYKFIPGERITVYASYRDLNYSPPTNPDGVRSIRFKITAAPFTFQVPRDYAKP